MHLVNCIECGWRLLRLFRYFSLKVRGKDVWKRVYPTNIFVHNFLCNRMGIGRPKFSKYFHLTRHFVVRLETSRQNSKFLTAHPTSVQLRPNLQTINPAWTFKTQSHLHKTLKLNTQWIFNYKLKKKKLEFDSWGAPQLTL